MKFTFEELAAVRQEVKGEEYRVLVCEECKQLVGIHNKDGSITTLSTTPCCNSGPLIYVNAARFRNNALDVAEELADAYNILTLWGERLESDMAESSFLKWEAIAQKDNIRTIGKTMLHLAGAVTAKDEIPVDRVLPK